LPAKICDDIGVDGAVQDAGGTAALVKHLAREYNRIGRFPDDIAGIPGSTGICQ
jgi:hypothetical protein